MANRKVGTVFKATDTETDMVVAHKTELNSSKIIFVSTEEASLASNKNKGINSPGWWKVFSYVNSEGTTRYKTELLEATLYKSELPKEQSSVPAQVVSFESIVTDEDSVVVDTNLVTQPAEQDTSVL